MAVSLPVSLTRHINDWDMTLSGSVGYQSYKQDKSNYFPGHNTLQSQLNSYASSDDDVDAVYKATSKNGIGYTLGVDARYHLSDNPALGANRGMTPSAVTTKVKRCFISNITSIKTNKPWDT